MGSRKKLKYVVVTALLLGLIALLVMTNDKLVLKYFWEYKKAVPQLPLLKQRKSKSFLDALMFQTRFQHCLIVAN